MTLKEMLETKEAKRMYRELAQKYHPDKGGSKTIMTKINTAKDSGDYAMKKLYNQLLNKAKEEKKEFSGNLKKYAEWAIQAANKLSNENMVYTFFARKQADDSINVDVIVIFPSKGKQKRFTVFNIEKEKTKEAFFNRLKKAIDRYI